jgi:hypothetical protein
MNKNPFMDFNSKGGYPESLYSGGLQAREIVYQDKDCPLSEKGVLAHAKTD